MHVRVVPAALLATFGCLVTACSSGSAAKTTTTGSLAKVVPASAGLIAGTPPTSDDRAWSLAGTPTVKTLTQLDLRTGKQLGIVPVSASATSVALSVSGVIGLGLGTNRSGAIEFHNGTTGAPLSSTPLAEPVIDVAAGADGTTFYALYAKGRVNTVAVINQESGLVEATLPVLTNAVAIVPTPDQQAVYVLSGSGIVDEVSASDGHRLAEISLPTAGVDLALAPSGKTLFVLGGSSSAPSISIVDLATDAQQAVIPAAADSVAIAPGLDDDHVYDYVGSSTIGNVQLIKLTSG